MRRFRFVIPVAAALIVGTIAALAQSTSFFTSIGDIAFPFIPPRADGTPGTIDNMTIGATTPRAGTFTTLSVGGNNSTMCASYYFTGTPAATNQAFYVATRPLLVASISEVHSVAAGGASTLDVTKDTTTAAPAAGTALTTAAFNLNGTANTVQAGTLAASLATRTMATGDRLSVKFNNAIQASAGVLVTACMAPI